eukprot:TRINITY_DN1787_c0_g4_i1.p1 TRINITY_DN1787_c0_g4~~TRINITY_DN1787_c0_g4_i1.p1  ORF type:complete len:155 (+),score=17.40 TRINITY_DN1787_c0_g4_i1:1746-2210(+)
MTIEFIMLNIAKWCHDFGDEVPDLRNFARKILSQKTSSSGCGRNWSTFSLIHTRSRNHLTMQKLEKLVFVHYNISIRARNLQRKDNGDSDPINLDYIFEDDPLNEWFAERDDAVSPNTDFLDESMVESRIEKDVLPHPNLPFTDLKLRGKRARV